MAACGWSSLAREEPGNRNSREIRGGLLLYLGSSRALHDQRKMMLRRRVVPCTFKH